MEQEKNPEPAMEKEGFFDSIIEMIKRMFMARDEPVPDDETLRKMVEGGKVITPDVLDPNKMNEGPAAINEEREAVERALGIYRNLGGGR